MLNRVLKIYFLLIVFSAFSLNAFASSYREEYISLYSDHAEITGELSSSQFGSSIETLDINSDGALDLVVSAPFASTDDKQWNGGVYILLGEHGVKNEGSTLTSSIPRIVLTGEKAGDQLGTDLTTGDYNNDGINDIAIGAYNAMNKDGRSGKVYVFFGAENWGSQGGEIDLSEADLEYSGGLPGDGFGLSVDTADLDGDGFDDLLIGAPFASSEEVMNSGAVYGYLGTYNGLSSAMNYAFYGDGENQRFGAEIASADINGDLKEDVIIGAYYSLVGEMHNAGAVFIFTDYNSEKVNNIYKAQVPNYKLMNGVNNSWFGFSIDTGDVNGDNVADIAVSSFPYKGLTERGEVSVYFGSVNFDNYSDIKIDDPSEGTLIGAAVVLGDINNDSNADIIVGAPNSASLDNNSTGEAYIVYGGESGSYSVNNKLIHTALHGDEKDDWFGASIHVADLNNDNYNDIIIGARYGDSDNSINNGEIHILYGDGLRIGNEVERQAVDEDYINRGELISTVLSEFSIREKKREIIDNCYSHKEFCLFNFLAMSSYEDIQLDPALILYPDVTPDHEYYEDINIGTILGYINGHLGQENSPYRSEDYITRIQALKVVLAASEQVSNKYRFELIDELGSLVDLYGQKTYFEDINPRISYMWWYPRYSNFAVDNNIVNNVDNFYPDNYITRTELFDMIDRTLKYVNISKNEVLTVASQENSEVLVSGNSED